MIADEDPFRIVYDWEPAEGITAPELRETFARVEIRVGPDIVTQVEDARVGGSRRSIYVPLYSLAEWIAYNWWFLSDHSRPTRLSRSEWTYSARRGIPGYQREWLDHHNLRAVGDGFVWPDLTIVPDGGTTAFIWRSDQGLDNRTVKFLAQGQALLDSIRLLRHWVVPLRLMISC